MSAVPSLRGTPQPGASAAGSARPGSGSQAGSRRSSQRSRATSAAGSARPSARSSASALSAAGMAQLQLKKKALQQQLATIETQFDRVRQRSERKKKRRQGSSRVAVDSPPARAPADPQPATASPEPQWGGQSPVAWHQRVREKYRPSPGQTQLLSPQPVQPGSSAWRIREEEAKRRAQRARVRAQPRRAPGPPKAGAYRKQHVPPSMFPTRYKRGELPCLIEHRAGGNSLAWTTPLESIDYERYLPMFFDGLRETSQPYQFMARQGVTELLKHAKHSPDLILPVLGRIVKPLRLALNTKDDEIVLCAIHVIQMLAQCDGVGEALIPFYRQLLTVFNLFLTKRNNLGDQMDYSQRKGLDMSDAVLETLELLERTGGENAFANIKYMIPTYCSSV